MSIGKLLVDLGGDVDKVQQLKNDPNSMLESYDLSDEHKEAVKSSLDSGDPSHIVKHMSDDDKSKYGNVQVNIL